MTDDRLIEILDALDLPAAGKKTKCRSKGGLIPEECGAPARYVVDGMPVCIHCCGLEWERWKARARGPTPLLPGPALADVNRQPEYVRIRGLPNLRFEKTDTPAGEGQVWLRPAFVALQVDEQLVEPWKDEPDPGALRAPSEEEP